MKFDVNLVLEADPHIVSNWTLIGTHSGDRFYEVPASGENRNKWNGYFTF